MPVNTEMRDDLKDRFNKSKKELDNAQWQREREKNAYEGALNEYNFYEKEASGQWGNDVPTGNNSIKREALKAELDRKFNEYQKASDKEEILKQKYEFNKEQLEYYQELENQVHSSDEDYDISI